MSARSDDRQWVRAKWGVIGLGFTAWFVVGLFHLFRLSWAEPSGLILRSIGTLSFVFFGFAQKKLSAWIWISMLIGAQIGLDFPTFALGLHLPGLIFLRLIKTLIAPLLFSTLVYGLASHADLRQVGRMGWKSLLYFEVVTTFALFIGLMCINLSKAGFGLVRPAGLIESVKVSPPLTFEESIIHIFPENIAKSVAEGQILQVVIFSILFAIGLSMTPGTLRKPMVDLAQSISEAMFKFTHLVMYLAPVAVGSAIAFTVATMGAGIFTHLVMLVATLYCALILFLLLILLPVALMSRIPILPFLKAIAEPVSIAFATASSEAALPKAMSAMERLGVPRHIVSFVMPTGYSFNLDGSTLYLSLASVFIAQAGGIHLSVHQQVLMVFTLMLASKGVAGVPRAGFAILTGMTASFGLPTWPIFILFGADALLDMGRTAVNVVGNCLATAVVARSEKEFDDQKALLFTRTP